MSLLREILEESFLLFEDVSNQGNEIQSAVKNMHPARIVYNGPTDAGTGERVIYPVAYGVSTAGNLVVRAFQPQGSTSSEVPSWKFFRLDRIEKWDTDNSETFNPEDLNGFNESGDEQMETCYAVSSMKTGTEKMSSKEMPEPEKQNKPEEPEKIVTSHPVTKGEVENGGADKDSEENRYNYTGNDAIRDILSTSNPKIGKPMDKEIQQNIDKLPGNPDNTPEAIPVRDPIPVTKGEVSGNIEPVSQMGVNNTEKPVNDGPITDDDVNSEDIDNNKTNPGSLTESFRSLTNRMNNLYKD